MEVFKVLRVVAASVLSFALASPAAALTTLHIDSYDAGWYRSDGYHAPTNTNIIAGQIGSSRYNNFFAFDLSGISGTIVSASLTIAGGNGLYQNGPQSATYALFQVATPVVSLLSGTGGTTAYLDLGSGPIYGSTTVQTPGNALVTMPSVTVALANALVDLNAAKGSQFAVGGSASAQRYLWGFSSGAGAAQLTLGVDQTVVLPLPAPLLLLTTALVALVLHAGRRGRRSA